MSKRLATDLVHAARAGAVAGGWHVPPIDLSTTYPTPDPSAASASLDALVAGDASASNPVYGRLHNGTVAHFETAMAKLEGCTDAVAFGSGMAALSALLLAMRLAGKDHVVAVRPVYGGSDHLLSSALLGNRVSWVNADAVAAAITEQTGLVLIETPANPTLKLVDIESVVAQSGNVPVVVDSTFATPVLQQPIALGATMVMHSATKFIGGHGDVLAGVISCGAEWAARLRQVRILTGGVLHPLGAYLLIRGLSTLRLRVLAAQSNAQLLAERLAAHPLVARVHYPGMNASPEQQRILSQQMSGSGCVLAFQLHGDANQAEAVIAGLQLITPAVSLGSVDTLIQRPAGLTHRICDPKDLDQHGVAANLLRVSVGIEDVEDLWSDLLQALDRAAGPLGLAA